MNRAILLVTLICLWAVSLLAASEYRDKPQQSNTTAEYQKLVITGVLQKQDGSPAVGVKVFIFPYRDGKVTHDIAFVDGRFDLSNPKGTSDSNGRFTIEFNKDYLKQNKTDDFCVGLFTYGAVGDPVVLFKDIDSPHATPILHISVFEKGRGNLYLNDIFKKIVIQ